MHTVSQRPHLRNLCEPLGGTEGQVSYLVIVSS